MKTKILMLFIVFISFNKTQAQSLNDDQTKAVFDLIFGVDASAGLTINSEDRQTANKLLNELIEKSCEMSAVQGLMEGAYSFNPSIYNLAKSIIQSYYSNCYKGAKEGKFYESVRVTIARNWKSAFEIRKQLGEW